MPIVSRVKEHISPDHPSNGSSLEWADQFPELRAWFSSKVTIQYKFSQIGGGWGPTFIHQNSRKLIFEKLIKTVIQRGRLMIGQTDQSGYKPGNHS